MAALRGFLLLRASRGDHPSRAQGTRGLLGPVAAQGTNQPGLCLPLWAGWGQAGSKVLQPLVVLVARAGGTFLHPELGCHQGV